MKIDHREVNRTSLPVFYDPTGKRWHRTLTAGAAAFAFLAVLVYWTAPSAFAPFWSPPLNQDRGYPRQLLDSEDVNDIPLIGDTEGGIVNRVVLIKREAGRMLLIDPFTGAVLREANEEER